MLGGWQNKASGVVERILGKLSLISGHNYISSNVLQLFQSRIVHDDKEQGTLLRLLIGRVCGK